MGRRVTDVAIAGGGIIGLSLGLELLRRGRAVTVIERQQAMSAASAAAGGMLAVHDPQNPPELMPLAVRSGELYPGYLAQVEKLSGCAVPVRTRWTMQHVAQRHPGRSLATEREIAEFAPGLRAGEQGFEWLEEASIDPLDLRVALPQAFVAAGGMLLEQTTVVHVATEHGLRVGTSGGEIAAGAFVNCCGCWAGEGASGLERLRVEPIKGQMANVRCAPERLRCVVRAPGVYMIPRGDGRVTIGSTIERVGFDDSPDQYVVGGLADACRSLLPEVEIAAIEMWAGLRPATPDTLPILGRGILPNCWHATGHYRDGILLAPVTARVMAQAICGEEPEVPLGPYAAERFALAASGGGAGRR